MLLSSHDAVITAIREPNILFLTLLPYEDDALPLPVFLPKPKPVRIAAVWGAGGVKVRWALGNSTDCLPPTLTQASAHRCVLAALGGAVVIAFTGVVREATIN